MLTTADAPPTSTSQLAITELMRALHAAGDSEMAAQAASTNPPAVIVPGQRILAVPVTPQLTVAAGDLQPGSALRSVDAIHVATAQSAYPQLTALITYDRRMHHAADTLGLPVAAPGLA